MRVTLRNLGHKNRLVLGFATAIVLALGAGGYAYAQTTGITATTADSNVKTRTITVPYTSVLAAPSDGNGGYLVDLGNFPANARIISTDLKINAPFTTSDSADVSAQLLLNDNINAGYNYPLGCYSLVSGSTGDNQYSWNGCVNYGSGSGPVLSVAGSLQLGVSGGANLSSLSSGQATIYVHYVKY